MTENLKSFLDTKVAQYNRPEFIPNDPVSIPHLFARKQDIEIMGFWAAVLAWGQRVTIINKCKELISLMDGAPYDFIMNHREPDLKKLLQFKHRTFNDIDTLYFIAFFRYHYERNESLESAFIPHPSVILSDSEGSLQSAPKNVSMPIEACLNHFRTYFFSLPDYSAPDQKTHLIPGAKVYLQTAQYVFALDGAQRPLRC